MKKFLTVLLALSVVFTYTVGTAFAAAITPADVATQANAKAQSEMNNVDAAKTLYLNSVSYTKNTTSGDLDEGVEYANINGISLSRKAVEAIVADVVTDAQTDVTKAQVEVVNSNVTDDAALATELAKITTAAQAYYPSDAFNAKVEAKAAEKYEFEASKSRYLAAINGVNPSDYSTTALTEDVAKEGLVVADGSRQSKVATLKAEALNAFETKTTAADAKTVASDFLEAVKKIKTIAQENAEAQDLSTVKENAIKDLKNNADNAYRGQKKALEDAIAAEKDATKKANLQKQLDALQSNINAIVAMKTTQINAAESNAEVAGVVIVDAASTANTLQDTVFGLTAQGAVNDKDAIAQALKDKAALDKITTVDGVTPYYQDGAVDTALENALVKVYDGTYANKADALAGYNAELADKTNKDLAEAKKNAIDEIKATDLTAYDETRAAEAQKLIDDAVAKIESATTEKAVNDAKAAFETALDRVITIQKHTEDIKDTGVLGKEYNTKYQPTLDAYVDYYYATHAGITNPTATAVKASVKAYMLEAYTKEEMAARLDGAKAIVDNLKTGDALTNAAKDVKAAIDAIGTNVTLDSKDAITAADKAMSEYLKNPGTAEADVSNYAILNAAKVTLQSLEKANVAALADAIATAADKKAAVDAAKKAYDAYVADYPADAANVAAAKAKIDAAQAAIDTAAAKEVSEMISKLVEADKVTAADKEAIEAASQAYAALTDEAKALVSNVNKAKLDLCEKALAIALANDLEYQKLAVKGTHVTINSKAGKGYIKISWGQKDNGVKLDGYEVYRSTKKNSGFKKISTFKVQKSKKYTKGMKKGTKYYFYVKGYKMVGDEKVYTHNSIKVYRTFRK